jgi:hypothetical protein
MYSVKTLGLIAAAGSGAAVSGYLGWRKSGKDEMGLDDRIGFTTSSVVAGATGGLALGLLGTRGIAAAGKAGYTVLNTARKGAMWNPAKAFLKEGHWRTNFGLKAIPEMARTPLAALAMLAVGVGAIAYTSRSNPQPTASASRDEYGNTSYNQQSVKERMGLLGATGDMVFGLNNIRHG